MSAGNAPPESPYGYTPGGKDNGVVKSKGKPTLHLVAGQEVVPMRARKPEWLKVRAPGGPNYLRLQKMMREQRLHTVCEEAHCPNIGECWESGTATFMILGDVCTRACKYCAVAHGLPNELDLDEPRRVADSVVSMGLEHAVITSVNPRLAAASASTSHVAAAAPKPTRAGTFSIPPRRARSCSPPSDSCARLSRLLGDRGHPCGAGGGHPGQDCLQPRRAADPFGELFPLSRL